MKPILHIDFCDFWGHFVKEENYFYNLLSQRFDVRISDNPDFLIYSCYGEDHLKYNCYRIYYNGENLRVNWNACDYAFGFDYDTNPRYYRLPNWVLYDDPERLISNKPDPEFILRQKQFFCNMVVSNPHAKKRIAFFEKLSKYKKVDSGGAVLNNIGGAVKNKRAFIRNYKFTIAFENSSHEGYTTEKLFEPMLENTLPIYWGDPLVGNDFNTRSFFNYQDYGTDDSLIERIIEVDRNDQLYLEMIREPWFKNNRLPDYLKQERILGRFDDIFRMAASERPVAQRSTRLFYFFNRQFTKIEYRVNKIFQYNKPFR